MLELIKIIALLCQLNDSSRGHSSEHDQLTCQKYYIKCVDGGNHFDNGKKLEECVLKKGE